MEFKFWRAEQSGLACAIRAATCGHSFIHFISFRFVSFHFVSFRFHIHFNSFHVMSCHFISFRSFLRSCVPGFFPQNFVRLLLSLEMCRVRRSFRFNSSLPLITFSLSFQVFPFIRYFLPFVSTPISHSLLLPFVSNHSSIWNSQQRPGSHQVNIQS